MLPKILQPFRSQFARRREIAVATLEHQTAPQRALRRRQSSTGEGQGKTTMVDAHEAARPGLPQTLRGWICLFGPGAIIASLTIGTGELVFSTRGGALFGYHILYLFLIISLLKWGLVISTSRHMILTGVHPYERMVDLPGPRGWLPIMLLLMAMVCLPIWISFHAGVIGNLTSWVTGTGSLLGGGMDYVWGGLILIAVLLLSATGGYSVLERVQLVVVAGLVCCALLTLVLYKPDWLAIIGGLVPRSLSYPEWLPGKYPEIARHSVWVETTRYVGVIGGAGFDYLAYTSWIREKRWGMLPDRATREQLDQIAGDPNHEVRRWIKAPLVDCGISFALIVAFSAVFVACGAMILGPEQVVPDENNLLSLQSRFVTRIHPLLLPLYVIGAFLTLLGTLYGTIEIACSIADEIVRSFIQDWNKVRAKRLKRAVLAWCAPAAILLLGWLFIRQATDVAPTAHSAVDTAEPGLMKTEPTALAAGVKVDANQSERLLATDNDAGEKRFSSAQAQSAVDTAESGLMKTEPTALAAGVKVDANQSERLLATDNDAGEKRFSSAQTEPVRAEKPRLLLAILTPVNLFTGVLSCGLICILVIWMDRRELPPALQPPGWLVALNGLSAFVFLAIGLKGYWDNENREIVVISMLGIFAVATIVALLIGHKTGSTSR
jgi:hypothetical protein